jgi:acetyl esterase/lipase
MPATIAPTEVTPGRFSTQPARLQRDVIYGRAAGIDLPMDVYYSAGAGQSASAVVYIHGGSFQVGHKGDIPGPEMDELMSRGFVLFSVSYRLAPSSPFPAAVEDCKAAVRHIRANAEKYGVDAARIGSWGFSAGGTLASMLGVADESAGFDTSGGNDGVSSRVRAVANYAGIADFTLPLADIRLENYLQATGAALDELKRKAAPVTYISADDPPFLFVHGDQDSIVPIAQSLSFHERLRPRAWRRRWLRSRTPSTPSFRSAAS